jgi:oxalate decarboxylase/phosphoglucose isomerase-like protein (cupin superfamily)
MAQLLDRAKSKFRRIVTKHDASGKATIWIDADATNHKFPNEKISSTLMWSTDHTPTLILNDEDEGDRILGSAPPPCGSRFTMMEFQPGNEATLHRTDTVDYVICLSGEIDMFLDDLQFITLRTGEVLVQRGTNHAWANRSDKPCRLAVILLDALPKREGSISGFVSAR